MISNLSRQKSQDSFSTIEEQIKLATLSKADKIETFNLLTWASLSAIFISIWQIIIPFAIFKLNFSQVCLGYTSVFFFIESIIVLIWSNRNYKYLRQHEKEENPILHEWHIEGTIYTTGCLLIACYTTFILGIWIELGYSWSLLVAKGANPDSAYRQALILVIAQSILIIGDISILFVYVSKSYHLEFQPKHIPSIFGFFLSSFVVISCVVLSDQDYIKSYMGDQKASKLKDAEENHQMIFWVSIVGIIISIFIIFENRSVQLQVIPKVRFYLFPLMVYSVIGVYIMSNSIQFIFNASQMNGTLPNNCKGIVQQFDSGFLDSMGCPNKYFTYYKDGKQLYSQDCPTQNTGIVWENDIEKTNIEKQNQLSCLNLNCCYMIGEKRSLKYKQFFQLTLLYSMIGIICAIHCFIIATSSPADLKVTPSTFSKGKLAFQLIVAVIAIIFTGFMALQYQPQIPKTDSPHNKLETNLHALNYTKDLPLASISACKNVCLLTKENLEVKFNIKNCPENIQSNPLLCNSKKQGFAIIMKGTNGVFQLDPQWDNKAKIDGLNMFDPYLLQEGLKGIKTSDSFSAFGMEQDINAIITKYLFFCQNPGKIPTITLKQKQIQDEQNPQNAHRVLIHKVLRNVKESILPPYSQSLMDDVDLSQGNLSVIHYDDPDFKFVKDDKFTHITIKIYDAEKAKNIIGATVSLYKNVKNCQMIDHAVDFPVRQVNSDKKGKAVINNVLIIENTQYMVQIIGDGFYYNCVQLGQLKPNVPLSKTVPLVPLMSQHQMMKVLLSYENSDSDLELGATYNIESKTQCYTGYYRDKCGGLEYAVSFENQLLQVQKPSQVITMNYMLKTNYMFFVKLVPKNLELKNAINNNLPLTEEQVKSLQKLNQAFLDQNVNINIYGQNRLFPVGSYQLQTLKNDFTDALSQRQPISWIALCLNGSDGPISQKEVGKFWNFGVDYWQRTQTPQVSLPNAAICDKFFAAHTNDAAAKIMSKEL